MSNWTKEDFAILKGLFFGLVIGGLFCVITWMKIDKNIYWRSRDIGVYEYHGDKGWQLKDTIVMNKYEYNYIVKGRLSAE